MTKLLALALSVACLPLAGAFAQKDRNHNLEVGKNLDIFTQLYKTLDLMYVDTLDPGEVVGTGIKAMLSSLDPYTEYYPEDKQKELKMMLTGKYAGIGAVVRYHQREKHVIIDEPYEGMPSAAAGLRKGDMIVSIDGKPMAGKTVSEVSSKLRGEPGTSFMLKVKRPTTGKTFTVKITRRSIKFPDIPYYGMRGDSVGYIGLTGFTEGCAKNMRRAFVDLKQRGATKLVLDLRNNGGGSLAEAVEIVNMWVPKGITLVETRGKQRQATRTYTTRQEPVDTLMPIVVLVNEETASASEITAGSLQDLDRAIIIGTRTYGKGLVQTPFDLPYNTSVKLTTGKYYIPSGRCVQAINYKHSGGGYRERIPDSLTHVFHTRNGREVRDGGGIKPDMEVRPDTMPNIAVYLDRIDSTEVMLDYVVDYVAAHPAIAPAAAFRLSDSDYAEFVRRVVKSGFTYDQVTVKRLEELEKTARFEGYYDEAKPEFELLKAKLKHNVARDLERHKDIIRHMLETDIVTAYHYQAGAIDAALNHDALMDAAMKVLADRAEYARLLKPEK